MPGTKWNEAKCRFRIRRAFESEAQAQGHKLDGWRRPAGDQWRHSAADGRGAAPLQAAFKVACITNNMKQARAPHGPQRRPGRRRCRKSWRCRARRGIRASLGSASPIRASTATPCELLGVKPRAVHLSDDLGINLKPARALGMRTIKVGDPDKAIAELEAMVGIPLRG